MPPDRAQRKPNVSRAITDYCHIIDFLRYLGNEAEAVQATAAKLTPADIGADLEDAYVAAVELRGGGIASLEASRVAWGWKGRQGIEFNGTDGSLWWDMEDLNRLHVFYAATRPIGPAASATSSSASPSIRSWTCGGRRVTPSAGSTASPTSGATS